MCFLHTGGDTLPEAPSAMTSSQEPADRLDQKSGILQVPQGSTQPQSDSVTTVLVLCARRRSFPQTSWNYSLVRSEDSMKVRCIEPAETWKSHTSSRPAPTLNYCDSRQLEKNKPSCYCTEG